MISQSRPLIPSGWEDEAADLIRLEAEDSSAVAWIDTAHGANCFRYTVAEGGVWHQLFLSGPPAVLRERPTRYGCPVLFPFPGFVKGAQYQWGGKTYSLPRNAPNGGSDHVHGFAHTHRWRVERQSAAQVVLGFDTRTDLTSAERQGYPFEILVRYAITLTYAGLDLLLEATNVGTAIAPAGLGFHPYFDARALAERREHVQCVQIGSPARTLPPEGETVTWALSAPAGARLRGEREVSLVAHAGMRDLVVFAPAEQPSIALEPLTCAHSAASYPGDHPNALPGLAPGATFRLAITIKGGKRI